MRAAETICSKSLEKHNKVIKYDHWNVVENWHGFGKTYCY